MGPLTGRAAGAGARITAPDVDRKDRRRQPRHRGAARRHAQREGSDEDAMRKRNKAANADLPLTIFQMAMSSAETIARRSWMMASGTCPPAEYRRMILEKLNATQQMGVAMVSKNATVEKLLKPWHRGVRRNVKRLRKRGPY